VPDPRFYVFLFFPKNLTSPFVYFYGVVHIGTCNLTRACLHSSRTLVPPLPLFRPFLSRYPSTSLRLELWSHSTCPKLVCASFSPQPSNPPPADHICSPPTYAFVKNSSQGSLTVNHPHLRAYVRFSGLAGPPLTALSPCLGSVRPDCRPPVTNLGSARLILRLAHYRLTKSSLSASAWSIAWRRVCVSGPTQFSPETAKTRISTRHDVAHCFSLEQAEQWTRSCHTEGAIRSKSHARRLPKATGAGARRSIFFPPPAPTEDSTSSSSASILASDNGVAAGSLHRLGHRRPCQCPGPRDAS
jgi:hypothetical protein